MKNGFSKLCLGIFALVMVFVINAKAAEISMQDTLNGMQVALAGQSAGRVKQNVSNGKGREAGSKYNAANQLIERRVVNPDGTIRLEKFSYNKNGQTVGIEIIQNGRLAESVRMEYDWLQRQTLWQKTSYNISDGDKPGAGVTIAERNIYRGASFKRMARIITDAEGKKSATRFLYDGDNVIAEYDDPQLAEMNFGYEPREVKKAPQKDKQVKLVAEYVFAGLDKPVSMTRYDIPSTSLEKSSKEKMPLPLAVGAAARRYYYSQDGLGSVRALTDTKGELVASYDYTAFGQRVAADSFGKPQSEVKHIPNPYTYTGRERSPLADKCESGSALPPMYYRWRMYSPDLGRFEKRDPIRYRAGENVYAYGGGKPNIFVDPYGLIEKKDSYVRMTVPNEETGASESRCINDTCQQAASVEHAKCILPIAFIGSAAKGIVGGSIGSAGALLFVSESSALSSLGAWGMFIGAAVGLEGGAEALLQYQACQAPYDNRYKSCQVRDCYCD